MNIEHKQLVATGSAPDRAPDQAADHRSDVVIDALGLLLRAAPDALDATIEAVLRRLAAMTGADRAYLLLKCGAVWTNTHEWCAAGIESMQALLQAVPDGHLEQAPDQLIDIPLVDALASSPYKTLLTQRGVQSVCSLPLPSDSGVHGALGLERMTKSHGFSDYDFWLLRALSDGLASALSRQEAERALDDSRAQQTETTERLRATLAAMRELVLELDETGRCIDFHCSEPELLAQPGEMILGRTLEETLPSDIAALQREGMERARRNGTARVQPYALGSGEGKRWYALTIAARARTGGQDGFVFRIRDVTDEHARKAENALLVQLTRRMTNLAMVLGPDLCIRWINPAMEQRTGYTLDEVRGQPITAFADPTSDPDEMAKIHKALTTRTVARAEVFKHDRHGACYCVDIDVRPFSLPDGTFEGFMVVETDITERKRHETDLKRLAKAAEAARRRLQDAIDAMPDGFAFFDADDKLVVSNEKYLSMLPKASNLIKPGMRFEDILNLNLTAGNFPEAEGQHDRWRARRIALHANAKGEMEIRLSNDRWVRVYERKTPDGGRVALRVDITELKETEQRLTDIIDGANIGIWEYDIASNTSQLNSNWAAMMGLEHGTLTKLDRTNWNTHVHPEDMELIKRAMRPVKAGESDRIELEVRLRHNDGHWVHVLTRGRAMGYRPDGTPSRISGIGFDLTARRHAEERLRIILEASSIGTWHLDCATGRTGIDDQYAGILGYSLDELQPWTRDRFADMVHPEDLIRLKTDAAALYGACKAEIGHEFRMRHRSGRWVWILSQARVTRWLSPGHPAEESGVHIDITERKIRDAALADAKQAVEEALAARRDSEQRFADIAAVSDEWFWEIGVGGEIVDLTAGFERMTGVPVDKVRGKTLATLGFSPGAPHSQGDWKGLAKRVSQRQPLSDFLFRLEMRSDRPTIWLRVSGAPYFQANGDYAGYRGVGSNVSDLIAATEKAEAANHAKSRFLANMSHELRTPLTGVLGMAELLGETPVSRHQRDMIDTIRESGEGLLAIVNDILDLAKIEAGKMTIEAQAFAPADVLRQVRALYAPRAHAAGLSLSLDMPPECGDTRLGDANRLQQILNNLVGNAIKFTHVGSVSVAAQINKATTGEMLIITVTDTGIGLTPDQASRVFDEFEQAEGSTARRFGGTGLGLSITRHLVTLLGGTISLQSEPGHGTCVTVLLPMASAIVTAGTLPSAEAPGPRSLAGLRVLVADDNRVNRKILETVLSREGLTVTLVKDGHEAHRTFQPGRFDLLLLDISMPGLDGIGALHAIRHTEAVAQSRPVPALAVTANAMQHQIDDYIAAGFSGHVAKPFRKDVLLNAIAQHCLPSDETPLSKHRAAP